MLSHAVYSTDVKYCSKVMAYDMLGSHALLKRENQCNVKLSGGFRDLLEGCPNTRTWLSASNLQAETWDLLSIHTENNFYPNYYHNFILFFIRKLGQLSFDHMIPYFKISEWGTFWIKKIWKYIFYYIGYFYKFDVSCKMRMQSLISKSRKKNNKTNIAYV